MQHGLFRARRRIALQRPAASIAIASMFGIAGAAQAFGIEVGNPDPARFAYPSYSYDAQARFGDTTAIYDFTSGLYNITGLFGPYAGLKYMTEVPKDGFWTADALAGAGVR